MQIFGGGDEFTKKKDIVNPNLIQQSTSLVLNGIIALPSAFRMGETYKTQPNATSYNGVWTTFGNGNWVEYANNSAFVRLLPNEIYTLSFWLKSDGTIKNNPIAFNYNKSATKKAFTLSVKSYGNNEYKFYGTFETDSTDPTYCLLYFDLGSLFDVSKSFNICIEKMKLEKGSIATTWCPAIQDYAMKSDLEALKAEIDQLKQK